MNELQKIISFQNKNKITNQQFADKINRHRIYWIRVKTGKVPLSRKLLRVIICAYPDIFLPELPNKGKQMKVTGGNWKIGGKK